MITEEQREIYRTGKFIVSWPTECEDDPDIEHKIEVIIEDLKGIQHSFCCDQSFSPKHYNGELAERIDIDNEIWDPENLEDKRTA